MTEKEEPRARFTVTLSVEDVLYLIGDDWEWGDDWIREICSELIRQIRNEATKRIARGLIEGGGK